MFPAFANSLQVQNYLSRFPGSNDMKVFRHFFSVCFLFLMSALFAVQAGAQTNTAANACAGKPHCDSTKLFSAEVVQVTAGPIGGRHHLVRMTIRFTNLTDKPLTLAYVTGTSLMVDNLGNHYTWGRPGTHDVSTQGIGIVEGRKVDPQFQLDPGEARKAVFGLIRYNVGRQPVGNSYTYEVSIAEVEKLPKSQLRAAKQYSLNFPHVPEKGW